MDNTLVPANTKKSTLIFGILRKIDAIIAAIGIIITIILVLIISNPTTLELILICLPMLIGVFLVLPIPNYHNVMCGLGSIISFYYNRRIYIWKGWCSKYEFKNDK